MSINNRVQLVGFCSHKPVLYQAKSGTYVASLNLYTGDFKNQSGLNETQRHRCVFLGKKAENAHKLFESGSHLILEGFLRYRKYQPAKDIIARNAEILVEAFILSPKEKSTVLLKRTLREILKENDVTKEDELGILDYE